MSTTTTVTAPTDAELLRAAADHARHQDTAALLSALLPGLDGVELRALTDRCRFAHTALLVFPPDAGALRAMLAGAGLAPEAAARPSTVVRERLAVRHGRDAAELEVGILRPAVTGADGEQRVVEVFALTVPPGSGLAGLAARERAAQHEAHLGFEVRQPDPLLLRGLCALLARHGARPDGAATTRTRTGRCCTSRRRTTRRRAVRGSSCTRRATTGSCWPSTWPGTVPSSPPRCCCGS
ncbi:hypothetical protein ACFQ2M_35425 [Kitasatospora saccharophila]|uniref:hypothetical protein n=1 Tax=Kitasatospora saccharophila TaxID=407973 RepID=UPI0036453EBE